MTEPSNNQLDPYLLAPLDLEEQSIRLVELLPSDKQDIKCRLRSYSSGPDRPPYIALSYMWDHKSPKDPVEINGARVDVGHSLWTFLTEMQRRGNCSVLYWIDAICINQANIKERNHQVQMMKDIYTNADSVSIWLGEADEDGFSDLAMDYIASLELEYGDQRRLPVCDLKTGRALRKFCFNPYWSRMWIIQEVAVAKEVTISFGTKDVDFFRFAEFNRSIYLFGKGGFSTEYPVPDLIGGSSGNPSYKIYSQRILWQHDVPRSWISLLSTFEFHEVADFRDRVFALRGLVKNGVDLMVDYTISREALVKQVILQHYRSEPTHPIELPPNILRFGGWLADLFGTAYDKEALKQCIDADWSRVLDWSAVAKAA